MEPVNENGRLHGRAAIVTGASTGIGRATAMLFAQEGAAVAICGRHMDKLKPVADEITAAGGNVFALEADVSIEEDCIRLVQETYNKFGKIDILVNNAGIVDKHRPITRCDTKWWKNIMAIDLDSVYYMSREVLKYMEPAGYGSIVNVSSIGGVFGSSGVAYSSAKAAVIGMTKNIAIQYAGLGIRCNAICPGPTPTALNTPDQIATFDTEFADRCNRHMDITCGEAQPEDQAQAILYFASDASKAVTGQYLIIDNGCTL
jgi:NAD(P)-dependent dehydrogenase (short-subunit alcohol dehydrogenase family)